MAEPVLLAVSRGTSSSTGAAAVAALVAAVRVRLDTRVEGGVGDVRQARLAHVARRARDGSRYQTPR